MTTSIPTDPDSDTPVSLRPRPSPFPSPCNPHLLPTPPARHQHHPPCSPQLFLGGTTSSLLSRHGRNDYPHAVPPTESAQHLPPTKPRRTRPAPRARNTRGRAVQYSTERAMKPRTNAKKTIVTSSPSAPRRASNKCTASDPGGGEGGGERDDGSIILISLSPLSSSLRFTSRDHLAFLPRR